MAAWRTASAERVDRNGIDLALETPRGPVTARVDFGQPVAEAEYPDGLRAAFAELSRRARATLSADHGESSAS